MKNCSIFLGLVLLSGCAKLQWFDELKSGEAYSSGRRTFQTSPSYAYDAPVATTNYDRIDNAQIMVLQKTKAKGGTSVATAGTPPIIKIYKEGLHWTDKRGGYYTRHEGNLKDNNGVLYSENGSIWTPL